MPAQHTNMTDSPQGRSEDDLRAVLGALERLAPSRESVLDPGVRRRRVAIGRRGPVAAVLCAVACVAAAFALSGRGATTPAGSASHPSVRQFILAAFDSASGMVLESHETFTTGGAASGRAVVWSGPTLPRPGEAARYRYVEMTSGGRPTSELAELYTAKRPDLGRLSQHVVGAAGVGRRITTVSYPERTWMSRRTHQSAFVSLADNPALLRAEIARGWWTVVKHGVVDGRPAIELSWNQSPAANAWPAGNPGAAGTLRRTLWVDSRSYLPIRQRIQLTGSGAPRYAVTATYRLLPPTKANLARLDPVIPKGFARKSEGAGAIPLAVSPFL